MGMGHMIKTLFRKFGGFGTARHATPAIFVAPRDAPGLRHRRRPLRISFVETAAISRIAKGRAAL